jgi:hypothetical protein
VSFQRGNHFTFTLDLYADETVMLFVQAKGLAPVMRAIPAKALNKPLKIVMRAHGHRMEGKVVDERGKPVVGADISLEFDDDQNSLPKGMSRCAGFLPHAHSDKHGHFLLTDLPANHFLVSVSARGYASMAPLWAPTDALPFPLDRRGIITLRRLTKICGHLIRQRDGKPVTTFSIMVARGGTGDPGAMTQASDGAFVIYKNDADFRTDPVSLFIEAPGHRLTCVTGLQYAADAKPLSTRLPDSDTLTGRITEKDSGKPLADVLVTATREYFDQWIFGDFDGEGIPRAQARTDADGRFTLEARTPILALTLQKSGYERGEYDEVDIATPFSATMIQQK